MTRSRSVEPQQALALLWSGLTVAEIAREIGCNRRTIYRAIELARLLELRQGLPRAWTPTFPAGSFTPGTRCNHHIHPIRVGSTLYCPLCHKTGWDWHPSLKGVKPLPKDRKPPAKPKPKPTRRQKRAEMHKGKVS